MYIWGDDRPYNSYAAYFRRLFGSRVQKVAVNAGFTCPNRDGTIDTRGCSFCSAGGSGEFAASRRLSITEQIEEAKARIREKLPKNGEVGYLAYFQAFTNTYAPVEVLKKVCKALECSIGDIMDLVPGKDEKFQ